MSRARMKVWQKDCGREELGDLCDGVGGMDGDEL